MQARKTCTQSELIAEGWTKALIAKFLPEPELRDNPHYKCAAPMKIWSREVVEAAMQAEGYAEAKARSDKRKASAKKAVKTKIVKLDEYIDKCLLNAQIEVIPIDELRERTLQKKQEWYDYQALLRDQWSDERSVDFANESTVKRWMVNYVRHNLTEYEDTLYRLKGKIGRKDVYYKLHDGIIKKIANTYPMLSDACEDQLLIH